MEAKQTRRKLLERVLQIPVFGPGKNKGGLRESEIRTLVEYARQEGGDTEYVEKLVRERGRPLSMYDAGFTSRCWVCTALRNYCCC